GRAPAPPASGRPSGAGQSRVRSWPGILLHSRAMRTSLLAIAIGLALATSTIPSSVADAQGAKQAPIFEVDPLWPLPLPNHWVTGATVGLSADAQDRAWTIHRPNTVEDNFKAADIMLGDARGRDDEAQPGAAASTATGRTPIGKCCKVAPPVLVYDQTG